MGHYQTRCGGKATPGVSPRVVTLREGDDDTKTDDHLERAGVPEGTLHDGKLWLADIHVTRCCRSRWTGRPSWPGWWTSERAGLLPDGTLLP